MPISDPNSTKNKTTTTPVDEVLELKLENARLNGEIRLLQQAKTSLTISATLNTLIRWVGVIAVAYLAKESIVALAGHSTTADIAVKALGDFQMSQGLAWLLAGGGISYGKLQERIRKNTLKEKEDHIRQLESRIDPNRSSSDFD